MDEHVFEGLIVFFRRRRWRHRVGLVETIRNHRARASETNFEPSYGPKRVSSRFGYADSVRLIQLGHFDSVSILQVFDYSDSVRIRNLPGRPAALERTASANRSVQDLGA